MRILSKSSINFLVAGSLWRRRHCRHYCPGVACRVALKASTSRAVSARGRLHEAVNVEEIRQDLRGGL